ncbi:hypothetical protein GSI_00578 [Ganoderma sinense ZZ0214-1]|uniref:Uncharacterized protein n=1 Tax=Ganoderma sinense ZZ0214-1 TaxID=1077348 RepID=A0A2G8STJ1_9APHY|nr:hypothetical protein GSI_00578 [Ganoderma sinense ZZ0214-1]
MNNSTSSSSLPSSPSVASSGFLSDREVKKIEKIMARAAAADEKELDSALDDVKKAEKALSKSSKDAERAQKLVTKTKERELAAQKEFNKALGKLTNAKEKERKAQEALAAKEAHHAETDRTARQAQADLGDCQRAMEANVKDRETRLAEIRAQCGVSVTPVI